MTIRDNLNRNLYNVSSLSSDGKKIFAVKDENNFETLRVCVNTGYSPFSPLKIVTVSTGGQTIGVIEHSINICALKFQVLILIIIKNNNLILRQIFTTREAINFSQWKKLLIRRFQVIIFNFL